MIETKNKTIHIDTFTFEVKGKRLYIKGIDDFALHYDINYNYDVVKALIDFSKPHSPDDLDYSYYCNELNMDKLVNVKLDLSYPTWMMTEEGVKQLYHFVNNHPMKFKYNHENFLKKCDGGYYPDEEPLEYQGEVISDKTIIPFSEVHSISKSSKNELRNSKPYNAWKKAVIHRDKVCVICGHDKNLHAHHLFGYAENQILATSINNGVTLCKHCHRKYHEIYGVKDINPVDFVNFVKRFGVR